MWYTIVLLSVCLIHVNMLCWLYFALKKFSSNLTRFPVYFLMNFRLLFPKFLDFLKKKILSVVNMWFTNLHFALTNTVQVHQINQNDGLYTLVCDDFNFCQSKVMALYLRLMINSLVNMLRAYSSLSRLIFSTLPDYKEWGSEGV